MSDQWGEVLARQRDHVNASHRVDRRGWTDQQWIDDARRLMDDIDGSVLDLVNGHVMKLLERLDELEGR